MMQCVVLLPLPESRSTKTGPVVVVGSSEGRGDAMVKKASIAEM